MKYSGMHIAIIFSIENNTDTNACECVKRDMQVRLCFECSIKFIFLRK